MRKVALTSAAVALVLGLAGVVAIAARLLEGAPLGVASTSASLPTAIRAGPPTPAAQALERMQAAIRLQR